MSTTSLAGGLKLTEAASEKIEKIIATYTSNTDCICMLMHAKIRFTACLMYVSPSPVASGSSLFVKDSSYLNISFSQRYNEVFCTPPTLVLTALIAS